MKDFIDFIGQESIHQYIMAIGGSFFWILLRVNVALKAAAKKGEKFSYKEYARQNAIDCILIFLAIGIMVPNMNDIVGLYNKMTGHNVETIELFYYCPGPFTDGIYMIFAKITKFKERVIAVLAQMSHLKHKD